MNNQTNPSCLGYRSGIVLYTIKWGLFHKPSEGSLLNNQDSMESKRVFFVAQMITDNIALEHPLLYRFFLRPLLFFLFNGVFPSL